MTVNKSCVYYFSFVLTKYYSSEAGMAAAVFVVPAPVPLS